jgi:hypothetical protein
MTNEQEDDFTPDEIVAVVKEVRKQKAIEKKEQKRIIRLLKEKHHEIAPDGFDNFTAGIHIGYRKAIRVLTGESDND